MDMDDLSIPSIHSSDIDNDSINDKENKIQFESNINITEPRISLESVLNTLIEGVSAVKLHYSREGQEKCQLRISQNLSKLKWKYSRINDQGETKEKTSFCKRILI